MLAVQCIVQCCHGEELGPTGHHCWPTLVPGTAVFGASNRFAKHTSQMEGFTGIQKAVVDQTGSRLLNSDRDLFLVQAGLWEVLWSCFSAQPLSWSSLFVIKIHFSLHVIIQSRSDSLLLHRIREDTSKQQYFLFGQLTRHPLYWAFSPLQFASNAIKVSMLSSSATCVVVRGSASIKALSWSLSTSVGWPLHSSSSRFWSSSQNFLNQHCTTRSLAVPGPNALSMLRVVSAA